jgi:imidazolonepropionase-like amidohydrolase
VLLVFGTDGGVLPHGSNAEEFLSLTGAGLTPIEAIRAATINAATALSLSDSIGSVRPGTSADLIAVDGDPVSSAAVLKDVRWVMLRGRVAKDLLHGPTIRN